jgi:hypothetical protein
MDKKTIHPGGALFSWDFRRRHPHLILPKLLTERAKGFVFEPARLQSGLAALLNWADLAAQGALRQKETSLDSEFHRVVFGQALGYKTVSDDPQDYTMVKNPTVAGAGIADGALGFFTAGRESAPVVIIECKDATTDLDHDKFNGRTPVQQLSDYMAQLPETPWGILSNYLVVRLYHKDRPMRAYQEFTVADFKDPDKARDFLYLFEPDGLLGHPPLQIARALELLLRTRNHSIKATLEFYGYYEDHRESLIEHLRQTHGHCYEKARHVAEKIIDRIVFVVLCQSWGLLPSDLLSRCAYQFSLVSRHSNPRWRNFLDLFEALRSGHKAIHRDHGFDHPLFAHDPTVDSLQLDDVWPLILEEFSRVDFANQIPDGMLRAFFAPAAQAFDTARAEHCALARLYPVGIRLFEY